MLDCSRPPSLSALKNGRLIASFAAFSLDVRGNRPGSASSLLGDFQRIIAFLRVSAPTDEHEDLVEMQAKLRRLCLQIGKMPAPPPPTIQQLTAQGAWTDLDSLWDFIDRRYDELDWTDRSPRGARALIDCLALHLLLREHCVLRPSCCWLMKRPGAASTCTMSGCKTKGCAGNAWLVGAAMPTMMMAHHKTGALPASPACPSLTPRGSEKPRAVCPHS